MDSIREIIIKRMMTNVALYNSRAGKNVDRAAVDFAYGLVVEDASILEKVFDIKVEFDFDKWHRINVIFTDDGIIEVK